MDQIIKVWNIKGFRDIGIRKLRFVAKTEFLWRALFSKFSNHLPIIFFIHHSPIFHLKAFYISNISHSPNHLPVILFIHHSPIFHLKTFYISNISHSPNLPYPLVSQFSKNFNKFYLPNLFQSLAKKQLIILPIFDKVSFLLHI